MKYKVIFDTNSIRSAESVSDFLGGRADLGKFSKVSEIIIPDMVIEEIKAQKRRKLISQRDSFLSNPFHLLRKVDENETKAFDIDKWILELASKEQIAYSTISLSEAGVLEKMKKLSLDCAPPFEKDSDKGFKDAYIYFTILEFLNGCKDSGVYVVTKDERLKEALVKEGRIAVVGGFDEFERYTTEYFYGDYFISRLKEGVDDSIEKDSIEDIWLNTEGNWVLKIARDPDGYPDEDQKKYLVEADFASKEILGSTDFDIAESVNALIASGSFKTTHDAVSELNDYTKYFSDQQVKDLIRASAENSQIYQISNDDDIREFFSGLYGSKSPIIPEDVREQFERYFTKL